MRQGYAAGRTQDLESEDLGLSSCSIIYCHATMGVAGERGAGREEFLKLSSVKGEKVIPTLQALKIKYMC